MSKFFSNVKQSTDVLKYVAGPAAGVLVGALIGSFFKPSKKVIAGLKALTSGIILGAISSELFPEIAGVTSTPEKMWVLLGLVLGAGMLIGLRTVFAKYESNILRYR